MSGGRDNDAARRGIQKAARHLRRTMAEGGKPITQETAERRVVKARQQMDRQRGE